MKFIIWSYALCWFFLRFIFSKLEIPSNLLYLLSLTSYLWLCEESWLSVEKFTSYYKIDPCFEHYLHVHTSWCQTHVCKLAGLERGSIVYFKADIILWNSFSKCTLVFWKKWRKQKKQNSSFSIADLKTVICLHYNYY